MFTTQHTYHRYFFFSAANRRFNASNSSSGVSVVADWAFETDVIVSSDFDFLLSGPSMSLGGMAGSVGPGSAAALGL